MGVFILGISPGGLMSDAEVFGNLEATQRDVPRMHQPGMEIWRAIRPTTSREVLEHRARTAA